MPYELKVSPEHRVGVVRFSGAIDGGTMLRALDALYDGETWVPCFNEVWDYRPVSQLAIDPGEAAQILRRMDELADRLGEGQTAVIAPRAVEAHFAYMLFVRSTCTLRERRIFARLEDALAWLMQAYPALKGRRRASFSMPTL